MKTQPYIGITDFENREQARDMIRVFKESGGAGLGRLLMVGVMTSWKMLNEVETKWRAAWPEPKEIADIFVDHPLALNTLHYADFKRRDVAESLERVSELGGPNLDAVQLDMIWPHPATVRNWRNRHPYTGIVLQVNKRAIEGVGSDHEGVVFQLRQYGRAIDYVLLDMSMGRGKEMDASELLPLARIIRKEFPNLGLVAAGGLGPDTVELLEPLAREFPDISIDAQGNLRKSGNSLDPIDWSRAEEYIRKSVALFRKYQ